MTNLVVWGLFGGRFEANYSVVWGALGAGRRTIQWLGSNLWGRYHQLGQIRGCAGRPLPESIAAGDCDGDLYFVCWEPQVLKCIQPHDADTGKCHTSMTFTAADNVKVKTDSDPNFAARWFEHAQKHMTDTEALAEKMLIGKLYNAMIRKVDASTACNKQKAN